MCSVAPGLGGILLTALGRDRWLEERLTCYFATRLVRRGLEVALGRAIRQRYRIECRPGQHFSVGEPNWRGHRSNFLAKG